MKTLRNNPYCAIVFTVVIFVCNIIYATSSENRVNENPSVFSTFEDQNKPNTKKFIDTSVKEIEAYFSRVISVKSDNIRFYRSNEKILDDLNDIVNYYLYEHCASLNLEFDGFSPTVSNAVYQLDKAEDNINGKLTPEQLESRLVSLKEKLKIELDDFMGPFMEDEGEQPDQTKKYVVLSPIETDPLYELEENDPVLLDPFTNEPLIEDGELGERIVTLLESNNQLIELLSQQIMALQTEMIELKKEGILYQREFSDIHKRIDGLEEAIQQIRSSNSNSSSGPTLKPLDQKEITQVFFAKNSLAISPAYHTDLNEVFREMQNNSKYRIIVTGYADKSGNTAINNKISRQRALSVSQYLQKKGISKNRILLNFLGDSNSTKEGPSDRKVVIEWLTE